MEKFVYCCIADDKKTSEEQIECTTPCEFNMNGNKCGRLVRKAVNNDKRAS